jgi:uncharacterized protein (DUF1697 family)
MKYLALLRGINVGGNNIIKMSDLILAVEKIGFRNVVTYIQSGNIIFESDITNVSEIENRLKAALAKSFDYRSRLIIKSHEQMKQIIKEVPDEWRKSTNLRCYIAFISEMLRPESLVPQIEVNPSVDSLKPGPGVLYMTTLLSGLTRSRFSKIITNEFYKEITIRNYNTAGKILSLMELEK